MSSPSPVLATLAARRVGRALAEHLAEADETPDPDEPLRCAIPLETTADAASSGDRLSERYGSRAAAVRDLADEQSIYATPVCPTDGITAAEILHAIRHEWATGLEDLRRRTGLGSGPCSGMDCCIGAAHLLSREGKLEHSAIPGEIERFSRLRRAERGAVLLQGNFAREETARAVFTDLLGLEY